MSLAKLMCSRFKGIKGVIQVAAAAQEKSNTAFPNTIADQFRWLYRLKVGRYYRYVSKFLFMIFSCKCCTVIIQEPKEPGELGIRQIKELLLTMVNEIFRCVDN